MFGEFLDAHPLRGMLADNPACPFPAASNRAAWEGLPSVDRTALRSLAGEYRRMDYPALTASQYMAFARAGDRAAWEQPYFLRRRKLIAALMGTCESGEDTDLGAVIDGLWLICEESAWVVSAHNAGEHAGVEPLPLRPLPDVNRPYVDLFAAQTAMILSLTCALLADRLDGVSPLLRQRVRDEIERRVLTPFETRNDFWWMGFIRKDLCNWTPWIVSNVMLTACAWIDDRDRLCAILERGCRMLDRYIDVLPGDGGCDEGAGYWSMAGGALLDCLELLEHVTGGRMTFWQDQKLQNILRFPMNAWIGGKWFVNFADCDARPDIPGERLQFAGERLKDPALSAFGARFRGSPVELVGDTPQLWRLLNGLFRAGMPAAEKASPAGDVWLPDLQLRMLRRDAMTLVCKGGVNEGSHNHNDCGGFMVYVDDEPQIIDAGNMTYTGKTFSAERYSLWNIRSRYHNVPLIGEWEQVNGWNRRAREVMSTSNGLSMDIAPAYPDEAGALACRRELACEDGRIVLRDIVRTRRAQPVTEVFMVNHPPQILNGAVTAGGVRIIPAAPMAAEAEEIPVTDPRMAKNFPGSLWRVSFVIAAADCHDIAFEIERNIP